MNMSTENPLISIIVPVYNVEQYLVECIESIVTQSYKHFELLLIDDGSPDKCGSICDEYARKDERIRVFHKKNEGVSVARNFGLQRAHGEWITFCDSDDYLEKNALKQVVLTIYEFKDIDIIQFLSNRTPIDNHCIYDVVLDHTDYLLMNHPVTVWGSFFKKEIISHYNIKFIEGLKLGEDQIFLLDYIQYTIKCILLKERLYYYRVNNNSITMNMKCEDITDALYSFNSLKKRMPLIHERVDTNLIELFCNKEVINNYKLNSLRKIYYELNILSFVTQAKSPKIFYRIAKLNFTLAILILRIYHKFNIS